VDERRLPEQPNGDGEGRLVAWLGALALDRVEQGGLLTGDVRPGTAAQLDVECRSRTEDVGPEESGRAGGLDRVRHAGRRERVLGPEVEVAALGADGEPGDRHSLDLREECLLDEGAVLN